MNKIYYLVVGMILTLSLAACGGGGGSDGGDTGGGTTNPPVTPPPVENQSPVLVLEKTALSMQENTVASVGFTATDPDGDSVSVTATSNSNLVSVSVAGSKVTVDANDVDADTSAVVTVTASDGKLSVSKNIQVNVSNTPDQGGGSDYSPFTLNWGADQGTNLYVAQGAKGVFAFNVTLGSVDLSNFVYSVKMTSTSGITETMPAVVKINEQQVEVSPNANTKGEWSGTLTLSDGTTSHSLNFLVNVRSTDSSPFLSSNNLVFLDENESKTFDIYAPNTIDPNGAVIWTDKPFEVISGDSSLVSFSYDNSAKNYTITSKSGSAFNVFTLRIYTTDSYNQIAGNIVNVYVKGAQTELEKDLEEKLVLAKQYVEQSQELENVAYFLIDALELKGVFDKEDALARRSNVNDSRHFTQSYSVPRLACMLNAVKKGFVENYTFIYSGMSSQEGFICNYGESQSPLNSSELARTNHYANVDNYNLAVAEIEKIKNVQNNDVFEQVPETTAEIVNKLAETLVSVSDYNIGVIDFDTMSEVEPNFYSRYVGNVKYGSYEGTKWVWKPEYSVLGVAVSAVNGFVM